MYDKIHYNKKKKKKKKSSEDISHDTCKDTSVDPNFFIISIPRAICKDFAHKNWNIY